MEALDSLIERLPPGTVSTHHGELATHAHDRWSMAMLRDARGDRVPPPAAVVYPSSTEEVATALAWASEANTPVVPRGGGTGLVGGAEALARCVVVDLTRMSRLLAVDDVSQTVRAQAGIRGRELERELLGRGFTLGLAVDDFDLATLGGWIASAAAGDGPEGRSGIEEILLGLTVVLAGGTVMRLPEAPRWATGPDVSRLLVGSQGSLGVITEAVLSLSRAPTALGWEVFAPHSFGTGISLTREIAQRPFRPTVLRLLDPPDAAARFGAFGEGDRAILLMAVDEGAPAIEAERSELRELAREFGARTAPPELASSWWRARGEDFVWYEDVMGPDRILGDGVSADVFEAAASWRRLPRLYEDIRGVLLERAETVRCHLTGARRSGAALVFRFVLRGRDDRQVERLYRDTWTEASRTAQSAGGTLSHSTGVGLLKLPLLEPEAGHGAGSLLRAIKGAADPSGLLNPGKMVQPGKGL